MKKSIFTLISVAFFAITLFSNPADSAKVAKPTQEKAGNVIIQKLDQWWVSPEVAKMGESFKGGMQWASRFANEKETMVYIILGLSAIQFFIRLRRNRHYDGALDGLLYTLNWILFLVLAMLEIVYVMAMGSDSLWFCMPGTVGWLWTVINFLVFGFVVFNQFMCFMNTLQDIQYNAGVSFGWTWGIYSWPVALVAAIILGFIYPPGILVVGALFFMAQGVQIVIVLKNTILNGGIFPAVLAVVVYLAGAIATAAILVHFLVLLLVVLVGFAILSALGSSGGGGRHCPDCGQALTSNNVCTRCRLKWTFDK